MSVGSRVTLADLAAMKADREKSVCVVVWDNQMAQIVDRVGVDIVSVGDSDGVNLWGHRDPFEITLDELVIVARAVRRGVSRALVSCDFPFGPLQEGPEVAVRAAIRLVKEAGVDMVKLDGAADHPEAVEAVVAAGIPVFAQFGITPQTALRYGVTYSGSASSAEQVPAELTDQMVAEARRLESAGASLLNFTNSGPLVGPVVTAAVGIPVLGGFGGGPWLDGRIRMATAAIGYRASGVDATPTDAYVNVAQLAHDAISSYADDVRSGRQIRGGVASPPSA
jgi:3-methyl-2-oxobutanoate hydroxymethyltransferase